MGRLWESSTQRCSYCCVLTVRKWQGVVENISIPCNRVLTYAKTGQKDHPPQKIVILDAAVPIVGIQH